MSPLLGCFVVISSYSLRRVLQNAMTSTGFPLFLSRQIPWFPKSFHWFFLSFRQDILVKKKTYLFFLNVALVTLVYANITISWQLLRFNSLKKHFPQIYRFKRFENGFGKKVPQFEIFFPDFGWKTPVFPWFPWLEKVFKIFPEFPNFPDRWKPWSMTGKTLYWVTCHKYHSCL